VRDNPTSQHRAEVIERAINVEWLMGAVICQHYFKRLPAPFLFEVLYDEYFSFALKRRIIEKIAGAESAQIQALNRLNTIRNHFAHCSQEVARTSSPTEFFVPDPRNPDKPLDFEALYQEFMRLVSGVEEFLGTTFREKGGQLLAEPPK